MAVVIGAGLVVAACTGNPVGDDHSLRSTAASPTSTTLATTSPQARPVLEPLPAPLTGLPDCAEVKPDYKAPDPDPALHCVLREEDRTGLLFEVLGAPAITINVYDAQGQRRQSVRQQVVRPQHEMQFLADLDGTGGEELLVVTASGGSGGEELAVWHASDTTGQFAFAGTMFGFPYRMQRTTDGFVAIYAHASAGSGEVTISRFVDDKLVTLAVLDVEVAAGTYHPDWHTNGTAKCALKRTSNDTAVPDAQAMAERNTQLAAAGIDPTTAEDHFCSQPWVGTLYSK
ncbi:hypothetical protein [Nocardia tengchongensis]|uniref:hypothetical protein n=1 Tax=Nocardia tengchongensis TaxID=2055889 RepID=UPI00365A5B70